VPIFRLPFPGSRGKRVRSCSTVIRVLQGEKLISVEVSEISIKEVRVMGSARKKRAGRLTSLIKEGHGEGCN